MIHRLDHGDVGRPQTAWLVKQALDESAEPISAGDAGKDKRQEEGRGCTVSFVQAIVNWSCGPLPPA